MGPIGCYPGSFNPPTVAHLAVAEAAVAAAGLARVDLVVSRDALGKGTVEVPTLDHRVGVLEEVATTRPWLGVVVTDARLIVDIARPYDVVVMGADKWRQVTDPDWYGPGDETERRAARDRAVEALGAALVVARGGDRLHDLPDHVQVLEVDALHTHVSSTAIRDGHPDAREWLVAEAAAFDARTGAWSDPQRYLR